MPISGVRLTLLAAPNTATNARRGREDVARSWLSPQPPDFWSRHYALGNNRTDAAFAQIPGASLLSSSQAYDVQEVCALDRQFHFVLNSAVDHIQGVLRSGSFYEIDELELIAGIVDKPRRILDVGANLGNHSLYFAHRFDPEVTIPVEPNPAIVPLLRANLGLNWHPSFDLSLVGFGLSDRAGTGTSQVKNQANLGGARLVAADEGDVPIVTGDAAFAGMTFDLVKIDVEGMENAVISGMAATLARSNAVVFVEVLFGNINATIGQLRKLGYVYREAYQRYGRCINLIFEKA